MSDYKELERIYDDLFKEICELEIKLQKLDPPQALDLLGKSSHILQKVQYAGKKVERLMASGKFNKIQSQHLHGKITEIQVIVSRIIEPIEKIRNGLITNLGHMRNGRNYLSEQTKIPKGTNLNSLI